MINWSGYEWLTQERWGDIHPDKSFCWYDPSCINIDQFGFLHLKTKYNPKYFEELNVTSNIGICLVSCTTKFSHGIFEIEAKLPVGEDLWPAFWMYSFDSWPPEIDVLEAYTSKRKNYFNFKLCPFSLWNIQTNLHYGRTPNNKNIGGKQYWFGLKNPYKNFIKYRLEWRLDSIKWFYNNYLVRTIIDPLILDEFNRTSLNVIINNHVNYGVDINNPPQSDFIIKNFTYKKL